MRIKNATSRDKLAPTHRLPRSLPRGNFVVNVPPVISPSIPRFNVLGIGISALTLDQARDLVVATRGTKQSRYVCICGVHGISEAQSDQQLREILNSSWLNTPDGMPLAWLGKHLADEPVTRVYGPDLMLAVCDAGRSVGLRHFLYGGKTSVAEELRSRLTARYPGLKIVGSYTPPFRELNHAEVSALTQQVAAADVDVFWVGLSTPKQERFMAAMAHQLSVGVMLGVGAAFDFHSGRMRQAPRWMQRSGLEWFYRLLSEPRRLGRRYLVNNPLFVFRIFAQLTGLRKYRLAGGSDT